MSRANLAIQEEFDATLAKRLRRQSEQLHGQHHAALQALRQEHIEDMSRISTALEISQQERQGDIDRLNTRIRELTGQLIATQLGFIGPPLAARVAKVDEIEVTAIGQVDEQELRQRLQELALREPYMIHPEFRGRHLSPVPDDAATTDPINNIEETQ